VFGGGAKKQISWPYLFTPRQQYLRKLDMRRVPQVPYAYPISEGAGVLPAREFPLRFPERKTDSRLTLNLRFASSSLFGLPDFFASSSLPKVPVFFRRGWNWQLCMLVNIDESALICSA
jgi:hypothetical protein